MPCSLTSTALLSLAVLVGCTANAASLTAAQVASDPAGAGNLPSSSAPDRDAKTIAALRAKGVDGLQQVLREYDHAQPAARTALAATVDAVAAQRYATVSRLYWYTDLDAAKAEAQRTNRPILALRMLGRLDEDLSCANSRFFRTALYSNHRVADLLREQFVLVWTSERAVPRVTIDYGDGRILMGTVTGNSIHYVLDADGRVVDALPGLYIPSVFVAELSAARAVIQAARGLPQEVAMRHFAQHLQDRQHAISEAATKAFGGEAGAVWDSSQRHLFAIGEATSALAKAQRATMSKLAVEVPLLAQIAPGTDPGTLDEREVALWATIGQAMFGIGEVHPQPVAPARHGMRKMARAPGAPAPVNDPTSSVSPPAPPTVIDARARRLVALVFAPAASAPQQPGDVPTVIARFEQRMVADTALNQLRLRPRILAELAAHPGIAMDELNRWVYDVVFSTPRSDAWLGLLPRDEYTGLPGDGVVVR
jgi:hypothetical protein